jgi:hypothetical protein
VADPWATLVLLIAFGTAMMIIALKWMTADRVPFDFSRPSSAKPTRDESAMRETD